MTLTSADVLVPTEAVGWAEEDGATKTVAPAEAVEYAEMMLEDNLGDWLTEMTETDLLLTIGVAGLVVVIVLTISVDFVGLGILVDGVVPTEEFESVETVKSIKIVGATDVDSLTRVVCSDEIGV